jgi:hypothetical protein
MLRGDPEEAAEASLGPATVNDRAEAINAAPAKDPLALHDL